jgi:hypothetical protein
LPVSSHVSTPLPEHLVALGSQLPTQAPMTQAELTHATGLDQLPPTSQVSTPLPPQRLAAGSQLPTHAPATHA